MRLYRLDDADPVAEAWFCDRLAGAMAFAAAQSKDVQPSLWVATDNDIAAYIRVADD